jgi:hypothetical protein
VVTHRPYPLERAVNGTAKAAIAGAVLTAVAVGWAVDQAPTVRVLGLIGAQRLQQLCGRLVTGAYRTPPNPPSGAQAAVQPLSWGL